MGFKHLFFCIYLLVSSLLFIFFDAALEVWISFFVSFLIVTGITVYHIYAERTFSPFISAFIVFTFLFFLLAPMAQITSFKGPHPAFMQKLPYDEGLTIYANVLICMFNLIFFGAYLFFKKRNLSKPQPLFKGIQERTFPITILVLVILTCLVFVASWSFIIDEISRPAWMRSGFSVSATLIWKKVLFLVPLAGIILVFQYYKKNTKKATNLVLLTGFLLFFLMMMLWFKNPLVEKRNALGPIYICIIFLFIPKLLNTNIKTLFFLFVAMVIGFPLTAIFTHTDASFKEILKEPLIFFETIKGGGITTTFTTLNYDAFANIMATIDYVSIHGISYGQQALSTLFFFVPRGIWEDKPTTTGLFIGEYLMDDYGFSFANLSNPLVSEGYINFGIVGVIAFAILLAFFFVKFIIWLKSENYLYKVMAFYFAIHLIFLLRGDLANGYSFYIGTLIGVILIPKTIDWSLNRLLLKSKKYGKRNDI
jgi:hypothetical protein